MSTDQDEREQASQRRIVVAYASAREDALASLHDLRTGVDDVPSWLTWTNVSEMANLNATLQGMLEGE